MSNNKQMKLYTEEQVRTAIRDAYWCCSKLEVECVFDKLPPIELPSDEDIEEKLNVAYGNDLSSSEQSTKEVSEKSEAFAIGYEQGYNRALELSQWAISNLIPPHNDQL